MCDINVKINSNFCQTIPIFKHLLTLYSRYLEHHWSYQFIRHKLGHFYKIFLVISSYISKTFYYEGSQGENTIVKLICCEEAANSFTAPTSHTHKATRARVSEKWQPLTISSQIVLWRSKDGLCGILHIILDALHHWPLTTSGVGETGHSTIQLSNKLP